MIIEDRKYTDLLEDYTSLLDTYNACEREYKRLAGCYNALLEQNKQLQAKLNGGNINKEVEWKYGRRVS